MAVAILLIMVTRFSQFHLPGMVLHPDFRQFRLYFSHDGLELRIASQCFQEWVPFDIGKDIYPLAHPGS